MPYFQVRLSSVPSHGVAGAANPMELVSWETGQRPISPWPDAVDGLLAELVNGLSTNYCAHRESGEQLMCRGCTADLIGVAHRCTGTGRAPVGGRLDELAELYIKLVARTTLYECGQSAGFMRVWQAIADSVVTRALVERVICLDPSAAVDDLSEIECPVVSDMFGIELLEQFDADALRATFGEADYWGKDELRFVHEVVTEFHELAQTEPVAFDGGRTYAAMIDLADEIDHVNQD